VATIAMKFGGTSVADIDRIRHVATLVKREVERGNKVAVVVSAMAGETNKLVAWTNDAARPDAAGLAALPDQREYDVVVAAGEARSWQGWQIPINDRAVHGSARIADIDGAD
jgi:aspartate kinase